MRQHEARATVTRATIVDAALNIVDELGIEGLRIRAVARATGTPAMSLYSHFANKQELLDLMYAEIARRICADAEHATWQEGLRGLCQQIRERLLEHPRWLPLLTRPAIPLTVPLRERILTLMAPAGIPPEAGISSITSAALLALGLTMVELAFDKPDGPSLLTDRLEPLRGRSEQSAPAIHHAVTRSGFAEKRPLDLNHVFHEAVDAFVSGLETRFARTVTSSR